MDPETRKKNRKKKKRKEFLAKLIPVVVALLLIAVIIGVFYGQKIIDRYSYSKEQADLYEYFGLTDEESVAIILNNEHVEEKGRILDGACYFDIDTVRAYFTDHFYANFDENLLLYTTATDIVKTEISDTCFEYTAGGETVSCGYSPAVMMNEKLYINVEYLKLFTGFTSEIYAHPNHILVYTKDAEIITATVNKDTAARHKGGVKSPILEELPAGTEICMLEAMEDWTKVLTPGGYLGYVEVKRLEENGGRQIEIPDAQIKLEYKDIAMDGKVNMAFHQVFGAAANDTFAPYTKDMTGVNVIAPTWFRLTDNYGNVEDISSAAYVSAAHEKGLKVWAVWTDVDYDVDLGVILGCLQDRETLISKMISSAVSLGIDGINIDFESVKDSQGEHFVEFLRELSIQTHANNLVLSVDNYAPNAGNLYYNRAEQGRVADYVLIMGYDEHWGSSQDPGSVASIDFVENGIVKTAEEVPENKIINAIPFYTRIWKTSGSSVSSEAIGMAAAKKWLGDNGVDTEWNTECCQNYGEKEIDGERVQIWMEDEESLQVKLEVMANHNIGGVAEWKLGFEDSTVWNLISGSFMQR